MSGTASVCSWYALYAGVGEVGLAATLAPGTRA
jgi:hypothetical protein